MADGHRMTPAAGDLLGLDQPLADRLGGRLIVEKDVALGMRHTEAPGQRAADRFVGGPRIEEQKPAALDFSHHHAHPRPIGGKVAAHVIVQPDKARKAPQTPFQPAQDLGRRQTRKQDMRPGIDGQAGRFHRHMDQ